MTEIYRTTKCNYRKNVKISSCKPAVGNLLYFLEDLYSLKAESRTESRNQNTGKIFVFTDYLNNSNILTEDYILVRFDIVNIFPIIKDHSGFGTVKLL